MSIKQLDIHLARNAPLGRLLTGVGIAGLLITVIVVVLGLRLVDRSATTVGNSLDLTADAVRAFDETIVVAADATDVAASGLATITAAVADAEESLAGAGAVVQTTAEAIGGAVPDSIDAIRRTIPTLIQSAELLEGALGALSVLGVEFAPERSPADSLRDVEADLVDVSARLRDSSVRLETVGDDFQDLSAGAGSLSGELRSLTSTLERADALLDGYAETTRRTAVLVDQAGEDLDDQRAEGRLIVLLLGLLIGLGQVVPLALGWWLRRPGRATVAEGEPADAFESRVVG